MAIDIGRIAYQKYTETVKSRTAPEPDLLPWEHLGKVQQDAWRHAACAVLRYIDDERIKLEKDEDIISSTISVVSPEVKTQL